MKSKINTGFSLLVTVIGLLSVITTGLVVTGIVQEASAKKVFTAPVAVTASTGKKSSSNGTSLSSSDQSLASTNLMTIDFNVEAYFAAFNYYPGSIDPTEFTALASSGNYAGSDPVTNIRAATTNPAGVTYLYTPTPVGCSTAAKNCLKFTLAAKDTTGKVIGEQQVSVN